MNINDLSTQLLYTTLPIWVDYLNGQKGSGTGFIYNVPSLTGSNQFVPLLITNFHVVNNAKKCRIELVSRDGDKPNPTKRTRVEIDGFLFQSHLSEEDDLAALPLGPILNQLENTSNPVFYRSIGTELIPSQEILDGLAAIEEITFIGYPSGLYDEHNLTPIARRGITATPVWNNFKGQPKFLIDAGVFPGSSGSPVMIFNQGGYSNQGSFVIGTRIYFLGVLSESIIRKEQADVKIFLGLGVVTKSGRVRQFAEETVRRIIS